jgi:hypothetical protein
MILNSREKTVDSAWPEDRARIRSGWWLALGTMLFAAACWFWLIPTVLPQARASAAAAGDPKLAEVQAGDIDGGLSTMDGTPDFFARFKPANRRCAEPLAWVTVSRPAGLTTGPVRIRSGSYVSPLFELSDAPLRVAIPFPAPYQAGQGTLTVLANGSRPIIALFPAWKPYVNGQASVLVHWTPADDDKCIRGNG